MQRDDIIRLAQEAGADLIGIAPETRWSGWSTANNPRTLLPTCRSVIVLGRRILRGTMRGIEEGTNFHATYHMFGADWMEHTFMPQMVHAVAHSIEAAGFEAVPLLGGNVPGAAVQLDAKALGHAAGLGEVGKGGFFLSRKYGHRQRLAMILTDLALEGDPLDEPGFCRDCDACLQACPLQAYRDTGAAQFVRNDELCRQCANGTKRAPALSFESFDRMAASCGRACLVALESKIENRFQAPFRKRAVWTRDLDGKCTVTPLTSKEQP